MQGIAITNLGITKEVSSTLKEYSSCELIQIRTFTKVYAFCYSAYIIIWWGNKYRVNF